MISATMFSPSYAADQEVVVRTAQRVVVARAWTPCNAAVQHCLQNFGFQHSDLELEGSARTEFERILSEAAPGVAYAPVYLFGLVGVVVDVPPKVHEIMCLFVHLAGCLDAE